MGDGGQKTSILSLYLQKISYISYMKFERGIGVKKSLGIGRSYDTLKRGDILKIKSSFSTTRWGEINNHTKAWNKFFRGRYVVVRSTPHYEYGGKISFHIQLVHNLELAKKRQKLLLESEEKDRWNTRMKIEEMSRLQFDRKFQIVS